MSFVFNVIGVVLWVGYGRAEVIGQSLQIAQAETVCAALIGKAHDAVMVEQANKQFGLSDR